MINRICSFLLALSTAGCSLPGSAQTPPPPPAAPVSVSFVWSGAVTPKSATVKAKVAREGAKARLVVSKREDLTQPVQTPEGTSTAASGYVVAFELNGLQPDTLYHYGVEVDGQLDTSKQGRFRTFKDGPFSFKVALGSCSDTGSNHQVFDTIREHQPLFFLQMGDLHYNDGADTRAEKRQALDDVLASPRQSRLYREVPIAYVWDDHDFGGNDSDRNDLNRKDARLTYQEYVPHYSLPAGQGDVPIYQAFTVGRVRFVLNDLRSERDPADQKDTAAKTMMGAAQKAWFKKEVLDAHKSGQLVVWMSSPPWLGGAKENGYPTDHWGVYGTERKEIADYLKQNGIDWLVMVAGDAHMLAFDDGTNNNFATGGGPGFAVLHNAALDRRGSEKGGPYSGGMKKNRPDYKDGQFGTLDIKDEGSDKICVLWKGWRHDAINGKITQPLKDFERCFTVPKP